MRIKIIISIGVFFLYLEAVFAADILGIATGNKVGTWHEMAGSIKYCSKKAGLNIRIIPTEGSIHNLKLLKTDPKVQLEHFPINMVHIQRGGYSSSIPFL